MTNSTAPMSAPLTDLLRAQWATENGPFQSRVRMALVRRSATFVADGLDETTRRGVVARDILLNPEGSPHVWPMLWLAASDAAISSTVQDEGGAVFADDDVLVAALEKAWNVLHSATPA